MQLRGPCYVGHYHLHLLPAEVLCVLHQPACPSPSAFAVRVRQIREKDSPSGQGVWYPTHCQRKGGRLQWRLMFVPYQVVDHASHVPSLLCVQDPQHCLRGPHQCEPLHRHQRQCGHFCPGALYQQCECHRQGSSSWLPLRCQRTEVHPDLIPLVTCNPDTTGHSAFTASASSLVYVALLLSCCALNFSGLFWFL